MCFDNVHRSKRQKRFDKIAMMHDATRRLQSSSDQNTTRAAQLCDRHSSKDATFGSTKRVTPLAHTATRQDKLTAAPSTARKPHDKFEARINLALGRRIISST